MHDIKTIKTALCSFGMSGKLFHAPFINHHFGFELYAVFERTNNLASEIYPQIKTFRSLEALLDDNSIELIVVNTPNYTHFEYGKLCLQAGKHVIIEKPFTLTSAEAEELIRIAGLNNVKISVYQNRRWDSDFKTVYSIIKSGVLGTISDVEIHFDRFKKTLSPKLHKEQGPGSGVLYDLGPHIIDQALVMFGMPQKIFADLRIIRTASKVFDAIELILYYNLLRVKLKANLLITEPLPAFIVHGSNGSFIKNRADVQETDLLNGKNVSDANWGIENDSDKGLLHLLTDGVHTKNLIDSEKGSYMEYYNGIYNALRNNVEVPVSGLDGLLVIRIIEAAMESMNTQQVVNLNNHDG